MMKVIVTGSVGNISKPLTQELVQKGNLVIVISSNPEKQKDIEELGANAAIGSLEDVDFLTENFKNADVAYCMVPPNNYFDLNLELIAYYEKTAGNYAKAIQDSGIKRVVYLSSIGAHLTQGSGILIGHNRAEGILNNLSDVAITFMRPVGFYYNLFGFVPMIKSAGIIAANWGADETLVWVSPKDIAAAIVEEMETPITGKKIRYVASDQLTGNETASILGAAIDKPDLKWVIIPDEEMLRGLKSVGLNPTIAAGLVEMYASQQSGILMEDYYRNKPVLGKVKLSDFATDFKNVYNA